MVKHSQTQFEFYSRFSDLARASINSSIWICSTKAFPIPFNKTKWMWSPSLFLSRLIAMTSLSLSVSIFIGSFRLLSNFSILSLSSSDKCPLVSESLAHSLVPRGHDQGLCMDLECKARRTSVLRIPFSVLNSGSLKGVVSVENCQRAPA